MSDEPYNEKIENALNEIIANADALKGYANAAAYWEQQAKEQAAHKQFAVGEKLKAQREAERLREIKNRVIEEREELKEQLESAKQRIRKLEGSQESEGMRYYVGAPNLRKIEVSKSYFEVLREDCETFQRNHTVHVEGDRTTTISIP